MTDNSKLSRIFNQIQKAGKKGVKESTLFEDYETSNVVRVTKHRLCKMLGDSEAVLVKNGFWYLSEEYWSMTKTEFKDLMHRFTLMEISHNNTITTVAVVAIMSVLVVVAYSVGYNMGVPASIAECGYIFDTQITYEEWPEEELTQ